MKKGPAIKIEELEVGKIYSIAFGGVAYFKVLEKKEDGLLVEYPKNKKHPIQEMAFENYQDKVVNQTPYQTRFQERLNVKY